MRTIHALHQALNRQNAVLQTSLDQLEQLEPHRLRKHLKRRSVLLHQIAQVSTSGDPEERAMAQHILKNQLALNERLLNQIMRRRQSLQQQIYQRRQARKLTHRYRPKPPIHRLTILT